MDLHEAVIARRRRVPLPEAVPGDGSVVARQLDAALASAGFKLSRELFDDLIIPGSGAYVEIGGGERVEAGSLLSLPGYGTVQHTYEDMLAAHEALAASAGDRVTVLHKGATPGEEAQALYLELAGSPVPLAGEDLDLLAALAAQCAAGPQPGKVPVRENRAAINKAALASGHPLLADTVTDVLRLAVAVSGGDVTLEEATRFRSFARRERRVLMAALDSIAGESPAKLAGVAQHAEEWKRLGERLHPHEHGQFPHAQRVFAVARGEQRVLSHAARAEGHFRSGQTVQAARRLADAPGLLFRSHDRLLRGAGQAEHSTVLEIALQAAPSVSGRVLLSVREHFQNRGEDAGAGLPRIFANRKGRAWVTPETRSGIDPGVRRDVLAMLDEAVAARLPQGGRLIVDPAVLGVALPLSGKGAPFEAATVRMKSDLRGSGRVALPVAFLRGEDGRWRAKWLHFYLKGHPAMNVVQGNRLSTSLLARTVIERDYLRVAYLAGLTGARTADGIFLKAATPDDLAVAVQDAPGPVTYIGLDRPEGLPRDAATFTLANLAGLIPA